MSVEQAIVGELKAASGVSAIVGTRVYQLILPEKPTLPAVRVQLIDEPRPDHLRGPNGTRQARVQVDAFTEFAYEDAVILADEIDDALNGVQFERDYVQVMGAVRDSRIPVYEAGELRNVRIIQDFIVWWRATG